MKETIQTPRWRSGEAESLSVLAGRGLGKMRPDRADSFFQAAGGATFIPVGLLLVSARQIK